MFLTLRGLASMLLLMLVLVLMLLLLRWPVLRLLLLLIKFLLLVASTILAIAIATIACVGSNTPWVLGEHLPRRAVMLSVVFPKQRNREL